MADLSDLLSQVASPAEGFEVTPGANWLQGRTVYGGLMAALGVQAAAAGLGIHQPLRSAQFAFFGPASGTLRITPSVLRIGRSSCFADVGISGDAGPAMRATLAFGDDRRSRHRLTDLEMPEVPAPGTGLLLTGAPGAPVSMGNFETWHVAGPPPFSGASDAEVFAWIRHQDPAVAPSAAALIALADACPPAVFPLFQSPAPISTTMWSVDVLSDPSGVGWHLAHSRADAVAAGYSSQAMMLWDETGKPTLVGRQNVALYD